LSIADPQASKADIYSVEFFDLQLRFATKVAELSGLPFIHTVGSHTNIYVRLAMGPQFDSANPAWLEYISTLATVRDPAAWTHEVHLQRAHLRAGPEAAAAVGCFSYALLGPNRARLHFHPGYQLSDSPLSFANQRLRRRELTELLSKLASFCPDIAVVGASWLYNLDSYRRLFPLPYLDSLKPIEPPYRRMPLWGQLLHRDRSVRTGAAQRFRSQLAQVATLEQLSSCFPLPVLSAAVPAAWLLAQVRNEHCAQT
jgi:hypothetical protein